MRIFIYLLLFLAALSFSSVSGATRSKEIGEYFKVSSIHYLRMYKDRTGTHAVVKTECSDEFAVKVGNYLGPNDGRIMNISKERITIVEILPDGNGGWHEIEKQIPITQVKP